MTGRQWLSPVPLIVGGFAALLLAWVFANPPATAPDEDTHYVKAVATAYGQDTGARAPAPPVGASLRQRFDADVGRRYSVPARLAPDPRWRCNGGGASAACLRAPISSSPTPDKRVPATSHVGQYLPAPYLPVGVAARIAGSLPGALYGSRIAGAAMCLGLIALALAVAAPGPMRAAVVVALTPMVVFLASAVSTSGLEIAAAIASTTALCAVLDRRRSRLAWTTLAIAGVALMLARAFGPLYLAVGATVAVVILGYRGTVAVALGARRREVFVVGLLLASALVALVWDVVFLPHEHAGFGAAGRYVGQAFRDVGKELNESIGVFGYLNVRMPTVASRVGELAVGTVIAVGLVLANARQRVVIVGGIILTIGLGIALDITTQLPLAFQTQGRYVMPILMSTVVFAGWA
ncbi:MAG: DUF2142 domain-containing protein, partial [Acidimicrobiia bacterium]|nr:DUF2142 domain-containing protein [Acidimicrobiia bacterium]